MPTEVQRILFVVGDREQARASAQSVAVLARQLGATVQLVAMVEPEPLTVNEPGATTSHDPVAFRDAVEARALLESIAVTFTVPAEITLLTGRVDTRSHRPIDLIGDLVREQPVGLIAVALRRAAQGAPEIDDLFQGLLDRQYAPVLALVPRADAGILDVREVPIGAFVFTSDGIELGVVVEHSRETLRVDGPFGDRRFDRTQVRGLGEGRVQLALDSTLIPGVR